jgi:hypothetical protein
VEKAGGGCLHPRQGKQSNCGSGLRSWQWSVHRNTQEVPRNAHEHQQIDIPLATLMNICTSATVNKLRWRKQGVFVHVQLLDCRHHLLVRDLHSGVPTKQLIGRAPRGLVWVGYFSEPNHNHASMPEPHPHPQPPWLWMWLLRKTLYLDNQGSDWLDPRLI